MVSVSLRPNWLALTAACAGIALISWMSLPWPAAIASVVLGTLAFAGAEVDARTFLLPDTVTLGATACGIVASAALWPDEPWTNAFAAALRAGGAAALLAIVRQCYHRLRGHEGLGFGDVKLSAAVGAWLPFEQIPLCFLLATAA